MPLKGPGSSRPSRSTLETGFQVAWNFLTNEATPSFGGPSAFNDISFAIIDLSYTELADTNATTSEAFLPITGFFQQTGWHTFLSDPLTGGNVTLAFGVVDVRAPPSWTRGS